MVTFLARTVYGTTVFLVHVGAALQVAVDSAMPTQRAVEGHEVDS